MEQTTEDLVRYAGVGSQSDLGSNKGLQAKGVVRDNKFQLLAGSIIAPAAPALNKKYVELRAAHLEQGHIVASGGGCFRVQRDLPFKSASQAFVYAYGTNPPGGKLTWTPPSGPGRVVRKHTTGATDAGSAEPAVIAPAKETAATNGSEAGPVEVAMMDDDDDEEEVELPPPSPLYARAPKEENEDEDKDEDDEVEAELAYIEAKIRMLQIRKGKLLRQQGKPAKPRARNLKLEKSV